MTSDKQFFADQYKKKFDVDYEPILINGIEIPKTPEVILEARRMLWYQSDLYWKLDSCQQKIYDFLKSKTEKTLVVVASRRLGKSQMLTCMAVEYCLSNPKSTVFMLQPTQGMIRLNIDPIMEKIFRDCPETLKPHFSTKDNCYYFKNGSRLRLAGTDNKQYDRLRGGDAHLAIIDEAGFCDDLKKIINGVFIPATGLTKGKIILSSTPPTTPGHEFFQYMEAAEDYGTLIRKTIYDAVEDHKQDEVPRITEEYISDIIRSIPGGIESDEFKTEYLCKKVSNSDRSIIPEFTEVQSVIVREWGEFFGSSLPRPAFCDKYVAMDVGFKDLTAILFACYDFINHVVYIEDEIVMNGPKMTTQTIAEEIRKKERQLWFNPNTGEYNEPFKRVSDNDLRLINDLLRLHGIYFSPIEKGPGSLELMVNNARMAFGNCEVIIHPRCKNTISHLEKGVWDAKRKKFAKNASDVHHYDCVASCIYLLYSIDKNRNPFPKGYKWAGQNIYNSHMRRGMTQDQSSQDQLRNLFKPKTSLPQRIKKINK